MPSGSAVAENLQPVQAARLSSGAGRDLIGKTSRVHGIAKSFGTSCLSLNEGHVTEVRAKRLGNQRPQLGLMGVFGAWGPRKGLSRQHDALGIQGIIGRDVHATVAGLSKLGRDRRLQAADF